MKIKTPRPDIYALKPVLLHILNNLEDFLDEELVIKLLQDVEQKLLESKGPLPILDDMWEIEHSDLANIQDTLYGQCLWQDLGT